jgi:tetratricopeptide (TPR) repeat protein
MKKFSILVLLPLLVLCSKQDKKDALAVVGKTSIDRTDYELFGKANKYYPTEFCDEFPAFRTTITHLVETQALFQKAGSSLKNSIKSSKDWYWKKNFYSAQIFMMDKLIPNMGATEDQIKNYYEANKENFKKTVQVDSTRDSSFYQPLDQVRDTIVQILFTKNYPPDSSFLSRIDKEDSSRVNDIWFSSNKRNAPDFFLKVLFKEKYQKSYPDSIKEVYGDGKIITPEDREIILSWIKPQYRQQYENENGTKRLVEFLLQWKLFSEKANQVAFTSTPEFKKVMDWAWKLEVVNKYVKKELLPQADKGLTIDSSIVPYIIHDESNSIVANIDSSTLSNKISSLLNTQKKLKVDSLIYEIRKEKQVKFLQNDLKDYLDQDPVTLLRQADSLRDTGSVEEAQKIYTTLANDFRFSTEGKNALYELAKIQTERQSYTMAIENYRNFLLSCPDPKKKSITFFMIGFIYDEYMDKSELAEVNYKWVLNNDPECELADDAEFMMLHLGEPMNSVEELQAQTMRQNRKVESFEETALKDGTDSSEPLAKK